LFITTVESICVRKPWRQETISPRLIESALLADEDISLSIWHKAGMTDADIRLIESFKFRRGAVFVERRNRGYTLMHGQTGAPVARLRPYGRDSLVELLYWSLSKQRWEPFGPFGKTVVPVDDALNIIAANSIFWAAL